MFKKVLIFLLCTLYFVLCTNSILAESEFLVDSTVTYKVLESGRTIVTEDIILENNFSTLYATSYSLTLENISADNIKATTSDGHDLAVEVSKNENRQLIKVNFDDAVVGKGQQRHFLVTYENSGFAVRTGEIWEISIPRLSNDDSFRSYRSNLIVPLSFGLEAYVSPKPARAREQESVRVYEFNKEDLTRTGVTAGFGDFQVFNFTLNYHLENPLSRTAETEIAVPPDSAFQKVYLRSILPEPSSIRIDEDGNWLALYKLTPRQRIDVNVSGEVQIFASERAFPKPSQEVLELNLQATDFWQKDDPKIRELALDLKTPRAIYDYVSTTLKYDYERVRPNIERLGASNALKNPNSAICMEFTDLFIALARAAGIPAREINGYAYTENPEIQPLSLVADVLHSWPEYWDFDRGVWIPIDPTWGSTTGGVNFFDKLDLRHFAFVVHGADPQKPYPPGSYKLGANPQKDVFVSFGKLSSKTSSYPEITTSYHQGFFLFPSQLDIKIKNPGPTAYYNLYPEIFFDDKSHSRDFIEVLAPFETYETRVKVPYSFLGQNTPNLIKIVVDGSESVVSTDKNKIILTSALSLFIVFVIFIIGILVRWKKLSLAKFQKALVSIFSRQKVG